MASGRLLSLDEAAHRLGTTQDEVLRWVDQGLLSVGSREQFPSHQPSEAVSPEVKVDEDELLEVAEMVGWLKLSAAAWSDAEGEQ
jgi:hypothetical protein